MAVTIATTDPQLQTEPGAEGKPQTLLPGVAPIAKPTTPPPPRRPQLPPPAGGLFDMDARDQVDLMDLL